MVVVNQTEAFDVTRGIGHEREVGFAVQVVDQSAAQAGHVGRPEGFARCEREQPRHGGRIGGATEGARQAQAVFGLAHQATMGNEEGFEITTHARWGKVRVERVVGGDFWEEGGHGGRKGGRRRVFVAGGWARADATANGVARGGVELAAE